MKFRHELKYLINYGEAELLKQRLSGILQPDTNAVDGRYSIRSLYFDDYWNTAYRDKIGGFSERKKYRIRLYNRDEQFIRLECKIKSGNYISKLGATLSSEEVRKILDGDYGFLLKRPEPVCAQFYCECMGKVMRPKVYVDYEREPYILDAGNVRITFDSDVRGAFPSGTISDDSKVYHYVLEPGKLVLEVKYTEFLPRIVHDVLPMRAAEQSAVSKYALCCDTINYMTAYTAE